MNDEKKQEQEFSLEDLEDMLVLLRECYPDEPEAMQEIEEEIRRRRMAGETGCGDSRQNPREA